MQVRRLRKRAFASFNDQARTVLASKLQGGPQLDVQVVSGVESQDLGAFASAWNKVHAKAKAAGLEAALDGVRLLVLDEGRSSAKFQKGRLAVNVNKFSKNALGPEHLAHELGRRYFATHLTDGQRKMLSASLKDPEGHFAKGFRTKLFGKAKTERWAEVTL